VRQVQQERPDMVLLDMHLPDISGLEVIRRIDHLIAGRGLRVSILTGDPMNLDIVKAMSLGAFEYWSKPLDRHLFEDGLRRGLSGAGAHPARSLPAASPFPAPHDR
jgi:hypothetical protein